jgi:hypothetical protein
MPNFYQWKRRGDGGAELRTPALSLIVTESPAGWRWAVYNTGRYVMLDKSGRAADGLADAKRLCVRAAADLLRGQAALLDAVKGDED